MGKVININTRKKNNTSKYLLFVIFVLAIVLVLITRLTKIDTIIVEGNNRYTSDQIIKIVNLSNKSNIIDVYFGTNSKIKNNPYIQDIKINYSDYNTLKIIVKEKDINGYIPFMSKYLCIDKNGYVIDYTDNLFSNIPIIEGIEIDEFVVGERINVNENIIDSCYMFYQGLEKYNLSINKIVYDNNEVDNILVYINNVKIIFGDMNHFFNKLQLVKSIIEYIPSGESGTLDLRNDLSKVIFQKY